MSKTPKQDVSELDELRKSFGIDVRILAKYHPIEEVGLRAFDNNKAAIEKIVIQALQTQKDELLDWVEREVVPELAYLDDDMLYVDEKFDEVWDKNIKRQRQTINNKRSE